MYVIPFCMGPIGSPMSKIGVQITDSEYAVVNMHIMTRIGEKVLQQLGAAGEYSKCLHSLGAPLQPGETDATWPCNANTSNTLFIFPKSGPLFPMARVMAAMH